MEEREQDLIAPIDTQIVGALPAIVHYLERLDLAATARASFNVYSTREDIDALAAGLREVQRVFNG